MKHYKTPMLEIESFEAVVDVLTASDGIIRDSDGWDFAKGSTQEVFE